MRKGTGFVSLADLPSDGEEEDCGLSLCQIVLAWAVPSSKSCSKSTGNPVCSSVAGRTCAHTSFIAPRVKETSGSAQDERGVTFDVSPKAGACFAVWYLFEVMSDMGFVSSLRFNTVLEGRSTTRWRCKKSRHSLSSLA